MKKPKSVATILERELEPTIKEWLKRVNLLPEQARIPLSDEDRTVHLRKLFHDLTSRLRLSKDSHLPASTSAIEHGQRRRRQGYSPAMVIDESRLVQVVTFQTLHRNQDELDQNQVLLDVVVIADEVDLQLMHAVCCWDTKLAVPL